MRIVLIVVFASLWLHAEDRLRSCRSWSAFSDRVSKNVERDLDELKQALGCSIAGSTWDAKLRAKRLVRRARECRYTEDELRQIRHALIPLFPERHTSVRSDEVEKVIKQLMEDAGR